MIFGGIQEELTLSQSTNNILLVRGGEDALGVPHVLRTSRTNKLLLVFNIKGGIRSGRSLYLLQCSYKPYYHIYHRVNGSKSQALKR